MAGGHATAAATTASSSQVAMPLPPQALRAVAEQSWGMLDPEFPLLNQILPDGGGFRTHLLGTFGVLHLWGQPFATCRAGLVHTAYLAPGSVPFDQWGEGGSGGDEHDRAALRAMVGPEAEKLVALLSSDALSWEKLATAILTGMPPTSATLPCGEVRSVSRMEFAQLATIAVADLAECAHDVVAPEDGDGSGAMLPAVEMYWMSQLCELVREDLFYVPPVFGGCTRTLDRSAEIRARDAYWFAVQQQAHHGSSGIHIADTLQEAILLNPFVAEPRVLLSQVLMQYGRWEEASSHASEALHLFYQWGTCWDKRAPLRQWVALAQTISRQASCGRQGVAEVPFVASTLLPLPEYAGLFDPVGARV